MILERMVNTEGRRFLDEGADFSPSTYSMYGAKIMEQPDRVAWEIFDAAGSPFLQASYRLANATRVRANSLEELAAALEDVNGPALMSASIIAAKGPGPSPENSRTRMPARGPLPVFESFIFISCSLALLPSRQCDRMNSATLPEPASTPSPTMRFQ